MFDTWNVCFVVLILNKNILFQSQHLPGLGITGQAQPEHPVAVGRIIVLTLAWCYDFNASLKSSGTLPFQRFDPDQFLVMEKS